jgi:hypothetical protein
VDTDAFWGGWFGVMLVVGLIALLSAQYLARQKTAPAWMRRTAFRIHVAFKWFAYSMGLIFVIGLILPLLFQESALWLAPESKFGYTAKYSLPEAKVYVQPKPHDCEWGKAPIGKKYCHFEKLVTPEKDDHGKVTEVYVSWQKVED